MNYFYVIFLTFYGLIFTLINRCPRYFRIAALVPLSLSFITMYVIVDDQMAQDRNQYYIWYQNSEYILRGLLNSEFIFQLINSDYLFTILLYLLPDDLSLEAFKIIFSSSIILAILVLISLLVRCKITSVDYMPIVLLNVVCDRMIMDAIYNASRSSLAVIFFLIALLCRSYLATIFLILVSHGIHGRITFILIFLLVSTWLINHHVRITYSLILMSIFIFFTKMIIGRTLLPEEITFFNIFENIESESIHRGLKITQELTFSLAVQIFIGVILPTALLYWQGRIKDIIINSTETSVYFMLSRNSLILQLALVTMSAGLIFYPEIALSQRLFLLPLLTLIIFLPIEIARLLLLVKFFIIAIVMQNYI